MLIFERLEHLKKSWFFDANYLSDSLAIPKKKLRSRAKFFQIAHTHSHSHSHSLKILRKENDPFPDSHSLRIKGNDHRWIFMFLTDTTKTGFLHILVRAHLLVLTCQHSCMLLVIIDQIYQKRSRSIMVMVQVRGPGWCRNLVKNMLTRFFEGPPLGNKFLLENLTPFEKFQSSGKKRPGREGVLWTCVENISPANHIDCISFVYGNLMNCCAGLRTTVTLIISQLKWLPRLT